MMLGVANYGEGANKHTARASGSASRARARGVPGNSLHKELTDAPADPMCPLWTATAVRDT